VITRNEYTANSFCPEVLQRSSRMQPPLWTCGRGPTRGGVLEQHMPFWPGLQIHGKSRRRAIPEEQTKRGKGGAGKHFLSSLSL